MAIFESVWFWGGWGAVLFLLLMVCEAKENGFWAFVLFCLGLGWLQGYCAEVLHTNFALYMLDHLKEAALFLAAYLAVGVPWSFFKWTLFVKKKVLEYQEKKVEWYRQNRRRWNKEKDAEVMLTDDQLAVLWRENLLNHKREYADYPPKVKTHRRDLTRWMACWFTSLLWTFMSDFVTHLFSNIVDALSGWFQRISNRAFRKHLDELEGVEW